MGINFGIVSKEGTHLGSEEKKVLKLRFGLKMVKSFKKRVA